MAAVQLLLPANRRRGRSRFPRSAEATGCGRAGASRGGGGRAAGSPSGALAALQGSAAGENAAGFLNREPQYWVLNTAGGGLEGYNLKNFFFFFLITVDLVLLYVHWVK